jgi:hypothetical protein
VFLRLSACVDPRLIGAEGVWERARRAMDVNLVASATERRHRQASWDAFNQDVAQINDRPEHGLLPSFSANFDIGSRAAVRIQADKLDAVIKKWALGLHFHVWKEPAVTDATITVQHIKEEDAQVAFRGTEGFWHAIDAGPGIIIRYLKGVNESRRSTIYEFKIWGTFTVYASILERL